MANPSPHIIRLRGPWEVLFADSSCEHIPLTARVPVCWAELFGDVSGSAIFRRKFHSPTGLDDGDRVLIRIPENAGAVSHATLNGEPMRPISDPLPSPAPLIAATCFDVTPGLQEFNELEFTLECDPATFPADQGGLWQPVAILIVPAG